VPVGQLCAQRRTDGPQLPPLPGAAATRRGRCDRRCARALARGDEGGSRVRWLGAPQHLVAPRSRDRRFGRLALGHKLTRLLGVQAGQTAGGAGDGAQARASAKHRAGPQQPQRKGSRIGVNAHAAAFGAGGRRRELIGRGRSRHGDTSRGDEETGPARWSADTIPRRQSRGRRRLHQ